jgi:DNA polymerase I-like protein with 3'-5' exonuclease and polymerase domains
MLNSTASSMVDLIIAIIKSTMEDAVELSIPLAVDINAGKNWMEAK